MGDEEQNRIMKKLLIISVLALSSSMSMFADFSNRGRYSDFTEHKSSILDMLPILIFVGIVGIFLYYGAKEYWGKHKDGIVGNLTLIGTGILFVLFLRFGLKSCEPTDKKSHNVAKQETNQIPTYQDHTRTWDGNQQTGTPIKTKENDFLVAVVNNPSYSIYDLIMIAGLNSHNTQFLTEQEYAGSKFVRKNYTPANFHRIYSKLFKAWKLFQKCQDYDLNNEEIKSYMQDYSTWDVNKPNINQASNPQLIRALKVVPLFQ